MHGKKEVAPFVENWIRTDSTQNEKALIDQKQASKEIVPIVNNIKATIISFKGLFDMR